MKKNYDELIDQNDSSFPDNTTGAITEEGLRDFHTDMLDSMAIETDWADVTDDLLLNPPYPIGGSISIDTCLLKRTGDVVLLIIDGSLSISNSSFGGITYSLDSSVFDMGDYARQICILASSNGILLSLTCGKEQISFTIISQVTAITKGLFSLHVAFPYYKEPEIVEEI
jgi:hypothetical protein